MKKLLLKWLAAIYGAVIWIWDAWFRRFPDRIQKVGARVISVGNITWGGTGKTPLTTMIARDLAEEGNKVAVLIRGYGDDEVQELRKKLPGIPVITGRNRVKSAREAIEKHGAKVLVLDDAFQHRKIHRDLNLLMINSTEPFGPGGLIPLGTLREPLESMARADLFILTKCDVGSKNVHWIRQKINALKPNAVIFEAVHKPMALRDPLKNRRIPPHDLRNRKVAALSGIGDPHSFEKMVEMQGAEVRFAARYPDHHCFKASEIAHFLKQSRNMGLREAVTTEKDFIRLKGILEKSFQEDLRTFTFWILEIEFRVDDEEDFVRRCLHS